MGRRRTDPPPLVRLMAKVVKDAATGCWLWTGATDGCDGYGRFSMHGKDIGAHRASFLLAGGGIPDGYEIDHLCRMPPCVNPAHLRAVTKRENILCGTSPAAAHAVKTRCVKGHPLSGQNLLPDKRQRKCRACHYAQTRAYAARNRAKRNEWQRASRARRRAVACSA